MYDFFDMVTLSAVTDEVVESLDDRHINAALDFAHYVLSIDTPHAATSHCNLYTEENAVIRFAQWFLSSSRESGIDNAVEALSHHCAEFDDADTPLLTPDSAESVFQMVNALFPYSEIVTGSQPIDLMIIESQHEYRNGESTALFSDEGMKGCICIYQLQNHCNSTPEHVLLHELGHLLHMKVTGTLTEVPLSFKEYLCRLGTDCSRLSDKQLREIFADTFMLAVISQTDRFGDPLPQISIAAMQKARLEQFAFENQYIVAGCYEDIGYTGRDPSRPGLAALEADYAKGRFDAVLIVNRSRLYRGNIASKPNWPFLIIALDEM